MTPCKDMGDAGKATGGHRGKTRNDSLERQRLSVRFLPDRVLFIRLRGGAVVARQPHKLEVVGSIPIPATNLEFDDRVPNDVWDTVPLDF